MIDELTQEQMDLILCLLKKYDSKIITQKIWDELNFDFSQFAYTRKANKSNFPIKIGYSYEEFDPIKHSAKKPFQIHCVQCSTIYVTIHAKFLKRTFSNKQLCKACYSKVIFASERWKKTNKDMQMYAKNYFGPLQQCIKTCIVCGKEFTIFLKKTSGSGCYSAKHNNFCSKECHYKRNKLLRDINVKTDGKIEKNCVICGKIMYAYPSQSCGLVTCSKECSIKNKQLKAHKLNIEKRNCLFCQKEFEIIESSKRKFCSLSCHSNFHKNGFDKQCIVCGKTFYVKKSCSDRKCCNKTCQNMAQSMGLIQGFVSSRGGKRTDIENSPYFKSSFEADFYRYCKFINKEVLYESKTFSIEIDGKLRNYTPDFYLVNEQKFVELKGLEPGTSIKSKQINSNSHARDMLITTQGINIDVIYMEDFYEMLKKQELYNAIPNLENKDYSGTKHLIRSYKDEIKI